MACIVCSSKPTATWAVQAPSQQAAQKLVNVLDAAGVADSFSDADLDTRISTAVDNSTGLSAALKALLKGLLRAQYNIVPKPSIP